MNCPKLSREFAQAGFTTGLSAAPGAQTRKDPLAGDGGRVFVWAGEQRLECIGLLMPIKPSPRTDQPKVQLVENLNINNFADWQGRNFPSCFKA
ncbi:hypothetical protein [Roseibium sediminicola]|uniref:Uncharacterized protein n=1 Tax=Roseibium sediminicola TaxID=2933272 RepID=A0ABT0GP34_9HYPH|nr:hypothetical protein [Roseibium sp. CAU 1639]MCK7611181.1 hypothetical protein [Roseibium sp. CAU 1639]